MKSHLHFRANQKGVLLLEALIAILIFSIGILAIIGLQVSSIKMSSDAKYRSDANLLATQLVGSMWMAHSSPTFVADFRTGGAQYLAWASNVAATLPTTGASAPAVTIATVTDPVASSVSNTVNIDIYWSVPGESVSGASTHHYNTFTQIND